MFLSSPSIPTVSYNSAWLHSELKRILGASLIGLYSGDDLIYDSSGAITGIQQRQGQSGIKTGATLSRIKGSNGRNFIKSINPTTGASFSIGSHICKAAFIVSTTPNTPIAQQQILFSKNDDFALTILSGSTTLSGSTDMTVYNDNVVTSSIGSINTTHIYGITKSSTKNSTIYFPGSGSLNNLNPTSNISTVVLCSTIPTIAQRTQVYIALKKHYGITITNEDKKVAELPVDGAVVVAPLTSTWNNYGSVGGTFTTINAPTLSSNGATFDGLDDGAYLDTGYSADFTLVAKFKMIALTTLYPTITSAMCIAAGTGGWGLGVRASMKWHIHSIGVTAVDGTMSADTNIHVVTLRRSGGVTSLYIDGIFVISRSDGNTGGGRLVLAGTWASGVFSYPIACSIKNQVLYNSALSDVDRAKVEDWARE